MGINLIAPKRSEYVDHVSACIDNKMRTDDKIATLGTFICQTPQSPEETTGENLSYHEIVIYEALLKNLYNLPADPQSEILKSANGFQAWVVSKMYCKDEAVDLYAKSVLRDLNVTYYFGDSKEILLRHIFRELTLNSSQKEVDALLDVYREEDEAIERAKNKAQIIAEKVISVASIVFSVLAIPAGIYVGYLIFSKGHELIDYFRIEYLPILVNKAINNLPSTMIRIASTIYDWKVTISIASLVVSYTSLNNYAFVRIPVTIIKEIVYIPVTIAGIPFKIGYHVFWQILETTGKTTRFMREGSTLLESVRRARELEHAETLWVNQILALKVSDEPVEMLPNRSNTVLQKEKIEVDLSEDLEDLTLSLETGS